MLQVFKVICHTLGHVFNSYCGRFVADRVEFCSVSGIFIMKVQVSKAMAPAYAGLRMSRVSSNSWATPYAGSFRDCMKVYWSESLIGQFKILY